MCLDTFKKFKTTGIGWKVVLIKGDKYIPPLKFYRMSTYKKRGWNVDTNNALIGFYDMNKKESVNYSAGYHIFVNKRDAKRFLVRNYEEIVKKVKYEEVVATGTQAIRVKKTGTPQYVNAKVVVAKKFMFIKE